MREIEFRCWNGQEMCKVWKIIMGDDFTEIHLVSNSDPKRLRSDDKRFNLMQYTGLKDKNGKKIFDGDIINCLDNWHGVSEVFFQNGSWKINGKSSKVGFGSFAEKCEVIGNIYEN